MLDRVKFAPADLAREVQLRLCDLNQIRLSPALPDPAWKKQLSRVVTLSKEEGDFLEGLRAAAAPRAATAPTDPDGFIQWFEQLRLDGPGQQHPLFDWIAGDCTLAEMKWFLRQEVAGEAGFDDLTALTQVKLPVQPKLELARNYWDEMGRGNPKGMHGPLLEALSIHLDLQPRIETTLTEALALGNTMAGLASNRRYAYHSVGALGAIEMTAPERSAATAKGLKRLGIQAGHRHYFDLHAILDVRHSLAWNSEAIRPLVAADGRFATAIAEGALMRLECGRQCFERYVAEFGLA